MVQKKRGPVYDKNGRRIVKTKQTKKEEQDPTYNHVPAPPQDDHEDEKLVLPPLNGRNSNDLISNQQENVVSSGESPKGVAISYENALSDARNDYSGGKKSPKGYLQKGVLTRRTLANDYGDSFRSPLVRGNGSRLSNYDRGFYPDPYSTRYAHSSAPYSSKFHPVKQRHTDKVVNFYRSFNATQPELQFIISMIRHRSLADVMDEVCRHVFLSERERFIHTAQGTIINNVNDFEDGGIYFFGPPHIFDMDDYNHFSKTNSPSQGGSQKNSQLGEDDSKSSSIRRGSRISSQSNVENRSNRSSSEIEAVGGGRLMRRRRMIKVMINYDPRSMTSFLVDESKHRNFSHLLVDLSDQLHLRRDRLEKIVTQVGRKIQRVDEFFLSNDDHFIALLKNFDPYSGAVFGPYGSQYTGDYAYDQLNRMPGYYDHPYLRPVKVEVNGQTHEFDPPANDYYDQIYRRGGESQGQLQLDWVYGYNGKNCRNNIILLPSEEILYFVAKIAVILNDQQQNQRFYTEHTDEIRSIAQHPNQWVIATGQISGGNDADLSHVRIWDSKILITLNVLQFDVLNLSVECMDFCQGDNGIRLATVSTAFNEWFLTVWDWEESVKMSESQAYADNYAELDIEFDPLISHQVVTCGREHLFFWDVSRKEAIYEEGYFEDMEKPDYVTCLDFNMDGNLVSGDCNGNVHVWDARAKRTLMVVPTLHTGSIITLKALYGDYVITGGGADRKLTLINCTEVIPTETEFELPEPLGGVVAMTPVFSGFNGGEQNFDYLRLIVGASSNCILKGSLNEGFECVMKGVSDEVPAVAIHPSDDIFVTAGSDSVISVWSAQSKTDIWEIKQEHPCSAADFNPTGSLIAIGTTTGRWSVYSATDGQQIASFQCDRTAVTCISYSPEGDYVAVGMESGIVFFYKVNEEVEYKYLFSNKFFQSSREEILSIDWSIDGRMVRVINNKHDLFYWNMHGRRIESNRNVLKDTQLTTETAPMSYQTSGVWVDNEPGLVFKTSERSHNNLLFLTGGNNGSVRLYLYPCDVETNTYYKRVNGSCFHEVNIHSSEMSKVGFLFNDRSVLTSGLDDYCIAQWKIVREEPPKIEDKRFLKRYQSHLMDSLSRSSYLKANGYGYLGPRNTKDARDNGQGSLSRAQLSKRETVQGMLMNKSITD